MKIITVDAGKFNTKAMTDNKTHIIRTKLEEADSTIYTNNSKTHHIKWNENYYLLGDGANISDYDTSKQKLNHKLSAYLSCAKLTDEIDEIGLVILSPLSTFTHKQKREEFRQYILDDGIIELELDGETKQLILKDVTVFSEALAASFNNQDKFKNQLRGMIDIGGLNVNGVILNNMTPVKGTEFTINHGSYLMMEDIKNELNKELGTNIQDYQMESILKEGYYNYNKNLSIEIIQSVLSDHFKVIIDTMKRKNWDIKGLDIVATGGGALNLGIDNISKHIQRVEMSNDPVWDNCKGGQIVGGMIYG